MPSRARAGNLTAALVFVAAMELVLNRLANRLFLPRSIISGASAGASVLARAVSDSGPFLFHLTGVLALLMFALALRGLLRRRELFPAPVLPRFVITVIGAAFWLLATTTVLAGRVPRGFVFPLETSFGFLSLLTAAAFLRSPAPKRAKIGVVLFALPAALHVASAVLERIGWAQGRAPVGDLSLWGEACLIVAAASAPFTLIPRGQGEPGKASKASTSGWMLPLALAALLTVAFSVALKTRYDLIQAIALYGPHLEMPHLLSLMGFAYLAAALGWTYAVVRLFAEKGGTRLSAYGLLLLAIAGYPLGSPVELSVSLLGLLSLSVGQLRARAGAPVGGGDGGDAGEPALSRADWRAWIGRLATTMNDGTAPEIGPPEAVVVEEDHLESSRIRAHRRGRGIGVRFLRRRGRIGELEITVGDPGHRDPTAIIERHRRWLARSPEQRLPLPRMKTGDPAFDQKFSVHGQAALESETVRRQIMRQDDSVVTLWQGNAARYHATTADADSDALIALLDALIDLVEA